MSVRWRRPRAASVLVVTAVALSGCAGTSPPDQAVGAECGAATRVAVQGHRHLTGDDEPPIDYESVPPTSGPHPGEVDPGLLGVHDEPLREPEQVGVLAVDGAVVAYHGLSDGDVAELVDVVTEADRPVALTPYDRLDRGQVALTAWGVRQVCEGVRGDLVAEFLDEYAADEPDFSAGGEATGVHPEPDGQGRVP